MRRPLVFTAILALAAGAASGQSESFAYSPTAVYTGTPLVISDTSTNPDIIATLARQITVNQKVVGFAAEPDGGLDIARAKIARKNLHAIAINDISRAGIGFESDSNEITLLHNDGTTVTSGQMSKLEVALWLWNALARPTNLD